MGRGECAPRQELDAFIDRAFPEDRVTALATPFDRFGAANPNGEPQATLGLLATHHRRRRGRSVGQQRLDVATGRYDRDARSERARALKTTNGLTGSLWRESLPIRPFVLWI